MMVDRIGFRQRQWKDSQRKKIGTASKTGGIGKEVVHLTNQNWIEKERS